MPVFVPREGGLPVFTMPASVPVEEGALGPLVVDPQATCLVCGLGTSYMASRARLMPECGLCGWCWGRGWTLVDPPAELTERVLEHGVAVDTR